MSAMNVVPLEVLEFHSHLAAQTNFCTAEITIFKFIFFPNFFSLLLTGKIQRGLTEKYTRGLLKRITMFLHFSFKPIEKLPAGFNVQHIIGMNQSLIWLYYHGTLLMTSHGYIQHPAPFCTVK